MLQAAKAGLARLFQGALAELSQAFRVTEARKKEDGGSKFNVIALSCGKITDFHAGIEETLLLLGPRLRHGSVEIVRDFGRLPPVICRSEEMNQIFMNLLVNALQALEQGGVATPRIVLSTRVEGDSAVVTIADNGPGVPDSLKQRVFDPFFTTKPRGHGTGLGLSISTDIARRHGGSLHLERSDGGGARFTCRIPLASKPTSRAPSSPESSSS